MTQDDASLISDPTSSRQEEGSRRRDVLATVTVAMGCAGACAVAYPFLDSLNGTRANHVGESDILDVDLSTLKAGQQIVVTWRGWPVFVQRRTPEMLKTLQDPAILQKLRDPESCIFQQPKDATNWHRSVSPDIGVMIGICTHLGCVPTFDAPTQAEPAGKYLCPCHGSQFDSAGRAYRNAPAPYNLPVPPVTMISDTHLRIGESKNDPDFDIANIQQI
ncbi:ubiquinol-cytochrome c reductase iron-sulfur subunit [Gluconobacter oxydans]|uniref:ubiquinol-cytochrome c reductase iron-sulfur subunit n=1 Tax=Gluconobacter thailandicus TaxID=257438 RepID=UPI0002999352|nr:ubiquinol-cytochrome c reductase iron-sulfur subunit [Gluconobacter thailandicus]AFW02356.1 ubiquinol-cytochrome C reductase iron-sulfur subunit [Gluconobacter oxydans H24]ANQ42130.1 ubiquinol-cytochrome c reductase iron-sulfur subunit [Gluconobacter oxydans]